MIPNKKIKRENAESTSGNVNNEQENIDSQENTKLINSNKEKSNY